MNDIKDHHDKINKSIDNLIIQIEEHISYENKLLNIRYKLKPKDHPNILNELKIHKKEHLKLLFQINTFKNNLEKHIIDYDLKHLHGLSKI